MLKAKRRAYYYALLKGQNMGSGSLQRWEKFGKAKICIVAYDGLSLRYAGSLMAKPA